MKRLLAFFATLLIARGALAVSTSHWVHDGEADFKAGTLHNVVVTNLGDVKLSRAVQTIEHQDPMVTTVNALAEAPDGTIYAGTGPKGLLLAVKNDKVTTITALDNAVNILSLLVDDNGAIVLGTGGEKGRILRIDKPGQGKPQEIFAEDDVQYIWAMVRAPDGNLYAATGPNGQVFEIKPDGSHVELYKSSEDNITSMISDGKDLLYLGTDPDGLVIRLNRKTKESFILYNAAESEITALALDKSGNLYAASGEVSERPQPPQPEQPEKPSGRPEQQNNAAPIPSNPPPPAPTPPPAPNPNPGEPKPIPKKQSRRPEAGDIALMDITKLDGGDQPGGGAGDEPGPGDNPNAPGGANQNAAPPNAPAAATTPEQQQQPQGNAIYKIDPEGFVNEIFRENVVIYSMIPQGDVLLVGTGDDGNIYQVNPEAEETVVLAKVDAKEVICLLPVKDGRIFMGLANTGGISAMSGGYATDGNYVSTVLDATQVSRFGNIQLHGQLPDGTTLKVATRSGNVKDADSPGWSKWSDDADASEFVRVTSPSARFLQYRLTFGTTDPTRTAAVDHVDVTYQIPNLAPVIKSIKIGTAGDTASSDTSSSDNGAASGASQGAPVHTADSGTKQPGGTGVQTITWDASDPNGDALTFTLYFRMNLAGPWIMLKDDLKDTSFEWDTRNVADGQYQVKVVASDELANQPGEGKTASRVSSYYVVDNTPPTIGDIDTKITGADAKISLRIQDRISIIADCEYTIDSSDDWQTVLPVNHIFDSLDENVVFTLTGLTAGQHQVTIRATDSRGNQSLQTLLLKIEPGAATGQ